MNDIQPWMVLVFTLVTVVMLIRVRRAASRLVIQSIGNFAGYRVVTYRPGILPLVLLLGAGSVAAAIVESAYSDPLALVTFFAVAWGVSSFCGVAKTCPECRRAAEAHCDTTSGNWLKQYYYVCHHCRLYFKGAQVGD